jgi:hypothetical protein
MSYTVGEPKDGGFTYRIEVNGLIMTGWRCGTYEQVEAHAKSVEMYGMHRAAGYMPKRNADGSFRLNLNGKVKKPKTPQQQGGWLDE